MACTQTKYFKFGYFRENFIFSNSVKDIIVTLKKFETEA